MPVACSTAALTGSSGAVYFKPAATEYCLLDFTDFPTGQFITVKEGHDYRVNDPVVFIEEDGGNLDDGLSAGTQYYIVESKKHNGQVSATRGGSPINLEGNGGIPAPGFANSDTPGGHINMMFSPEVAVCSVREFSLDYSREQLGYHHTPLWCQCFCWWLQMVQAQADHARLPRNYWKSDHVPHRGWWGHFKQAVGKHPFA